MKNRIETIVYSKLKMLEIEQIITDKRMRSIGGNYNLLPLLKLQLWAKISDIRLHTQKLDYISAQIANDNHYNILNLLVQDRYQSLSIDEIDAELRT